MLMLSVVIFDVKQFYGTANRRFSLTIGHTLAYQHRLGTTFSVIRRRILSVPRTL